MQGQLQTRRGIYMRECEKPVFLRLECRFYGFLAYSSADFSFELIDLGAIGFETGGFTYACELLA